jgi:hypothetical protein
MADLEIRSEVLRVRFTRAEKVWGLMRDLDLPVASVRAAALVQQWREVRGFRVGTSIPRLWLTGRWYGRYGRQLVALRRGKPAVHLWLRDQKYDELLVSTDHPEIVLAGLPAGHGS